MVAFEIPASSLGFGEWDEVDGAGEQLHAVALGELVALATAGGHPVAQRLERDLPPALDGLQRELRAPLRGAEEANHPVPLLHLDDGDATAWPGELVDL